MSRRKRNKYDKYFSQRTHTSITAFSKNAAGGSKRRKSYTERKRNRIILITLAAMVGAAAIFVAAFFITDTMLGISDAEVPETTAGESGTPSAKPQDSTAPTEQNSGTHQGVIGSFKARIGSAALLDNTSALDSFINQLKSAGQNAVVIDFKDENGYLTYPSAIEKVKGTAIVSKSHSNAAAAVKKLNDSGITVIARIYCFKDPLMPRTDRSSAVHYGNSQSLWLDNEASKGGKPWLNPYAASATQYLLDVVGEVKALGVGAILLDGVQYPNYTSSVANFDGEKVGGANNRNAQLIAFVNNCAQRSGSVVPVICAMRGAEAISGGNIYGGGKLWDASAAAFAVDVTKLAANVQKNYPSGKVVMEIKNAADGSESTYILAK